MARLVNKEEKLNLHQVYLPPQLIVFLFAAAIAIITQQAEALFFIAAGSCYMFLKAPPKWTRKPSVVNSI